MVPLRLAVFDVICYGDEIRVAVCDAGFGACVSFQAEDTAIRAVLDKQVEDWNRGNIPAFVQTYAESCTFVGKTVVEGRAGVEARYRQNYPTAAAMGHLTFTDFENKADRRSRRIGHRAVSFAAERGGRGRQKRHF